MGRIGHPPNTSFAGELAESWVAESSCSAAGRDVPPAVCVLETDLNTVYILPAENMRNGRYLVAALALLVVFAFVRCDMGPTPRWKSADVNAKETYGFGQTRLHVAVENGDFEEVQRLIA